MSILSCEKLVSKYGNGIEIKEKKHTIEIDFSFQPKDTSHIQTNSTVTVTTPAGMYEEGQNLRVYGNGGNFITNMQVSQTSDSSTNLWNSYFRVVGFKLFFKDGYLKCIKKEMSDAVVANSAGGQTEITKLQHRNSFVTPNDMVSAVGNHPWMDFIQTKILSLAKRKGVEIPERFVCHGELAGAPMGQNRHYTSLDWLAYPLVREIDSVAFCRNMTQSDRGIIAPLHVAMNFKQLVNHYYGTSTSKLLGEIWKSLTFGSDTKKTVFSEDLGSVVSGTNMAALMGRQDGVLEINDHYVVQIGDRALNPLVWGIGPVILKTMGFDYFYKWTESLSKQEIAVRVSDTYLYNNGVSKSYLELLLKYISSKKMITLLCGTVTDWHYLPDVVRMLQDYPDSNEIPLTLKGQFPNGIEVNFKFKSMKELHDKISVQYTIIETEASKKDIPTHPLYLDLDGRERNGLKLVVPTNTTFLAMWGKLLSICVASYGDRTAEANALILGVEKDGEIKYCIEFSPLIMEMLHPGELLIGMIKEDESPTMLETKTIRVALPRLEEKHHGVTPDDVKDDTYLSPYLIQFRGHRNYDPDPIDKNHVMSMLCEWVEECKEEYSKHGTKAFYSNGWGSSVDYNNVFDNNAFDNMVNRGGQPDQLIMDRHQLVALQRALGAQEAQMDVPPPDNDMRVHRQVVIQDEAVVELQGQIDPAIFNRYANEIIHRANDAIDNAIINAAPV